MELNYSQQNQTMQNRLERKDNKIYLNITVSLICGNRQSTVKWSPEIGKKQKKKRNRKKDVRQILQLVTRSFADTFTDLSDDIRNQSMG